MDVTLHWRFLGWGLIGWLPLPVLATLNGVLRAVALVPVLGESVARLLTVVTFFALFVVYTSWFLRRAGRRATKLDLWLLGLVWMGLALAFEYLLFVVLLGVPLDELLTAYDFALVLAVVLIGPRLCAAFLKRY